MSLSKSLKQNATEQSGKVAKAMPIQFFYLEWMHLWHRTWNGFSDIEVY